MWYLSDHDSNVSSIRNSGPDFSFIIGDLSGYFCFFAPKFWEVVEIYEWYFVILWMQI